MSAHAHVGLLALLALLHAGCSMKEKEPPVAKTMGAKDADALHAAEPVLTAAYGSDPLQVGDLRLPSGSGPFPVVVVIHGGCWTAGFATRRNTAALATAITEHGYATWNIEYRQTGDPGGGYPGTLADWAQATDHLRVLATTHPLDLGRVVVAGHSAGGHAAAWVAARPAMTAPDEIRGRDPLPMRGAVVIDGPPEISTYIGPADSYCGVSVVEPFMGGSPAEQPARYAIADVGRGPMPPQLLVASAFYPPSFAEAYRAGAPPGNDVQVLAVHDAGHFSIIAPGSGPWKEQVEGPLWAFLGRETK